MQLPYIECYNVIAWVCFLNLFDEDRQRGNEPLMQNLKYRKPPIVNILATIMIATIPAQASVYYGLLSTEDEALKANGSWVGNAEDGYSTIEWTVSDEVLGCEGWNYSYTLTVIGKDISHVTTEVSPLFDSGNILGGEVTSNFSGGFTLGDYGPTQPGNSNPGIPGDIRGIKFDLATGVDTKILTWSFCSDRVPVWGDIYAKDGTNDQGTTDVYLYNAGFTSNDVDPTTPVDPNDDLFVLVNNHIIVPDSVGVTTTEGPGIPEPNTFMLGALGFFLILRRRNK